MAAAGWLPKVKQQPVERVRILEHIRRQKMGNGEQIVEQTWNRIGRNWVKQRTTANS